MFITLCEPQRQPKEKTDNSVIITIKARKIIIIFYCQKIKRILKFIVHKQQNRSNWISSYAVECTNSVYHSISQSQSYR